MPWLLLFLNACGQRELKPVDIFEGDACNNCKMAISEKRYASEFLDREGQAYKFDDIQCMLQYVKKHGGASPSAYFVTDFASLSWISANKAILVRSSSFKTPMNGNLAAFPDETKAKEAVARYGGEILVFEDLMKP